MNPDRHLTLVQERRESFANGKPATADNLVEALERLQRVRAATKRAVDNGWDDPHGLALLHAVEGFIQVGSRLLAARHLHGDRMGA